jgi:hypothetical protein
MLVSQVFIPSKSQKIEELGVGVVSNLHSRFHEGQLVQKFLLGHTHKQKDMQIGRMVLL